MKRFSRKFNVSLIVGFLLIFSAILCAIAMRFASTPAYAVKSDFKYGAGTKEDPFLVSTVKEFNAIATRLDAYFVQTEDIDFTGKTFEPIGDLNHPFTGHYSGNYKGKQSVLTGIKAIFPEKDYVGVFSFVYGGAVIEDIRIEDSVFNGNQNVGAVAGVNAGRIERAVVNAEVTAGINAAGGVAGINSGIISLSVNSGEITAGNMYAGGIAGLSTGKISDSYNKGKVTADTYSGGIVGLNNGKTTDAVIERTFDVGEINGNVKAHIAGDNLSATIKQGRYIEGEAPNRISAFNTGSIYASAARSDFEFENKIAFSDWQEFENNFMYTDGGAYPILRAEYIKVSEIKFNAGTAVKLKPGEELDVGAYVVPKRANTQFVNLSVEAGADLCTLSNGIIRINDDAEVGSFINIAGEAEGAVGLLSIEVEKIPVERIEIATANEEVTVVPGGKLQFGTAIFPANASVKEVKYSSTNPYYADVDANGNLNVALDAPVGLSFTISAASYDNISIRSEIEITVIAAQVRYVGITNAVTDFKVTESLKLTGHAVTDSLETNDIEFKINSAFTTAEGAKIVDGVLYAESPGAICVVPAYAGVEGEAVTFTSLKEQVVSLEFVNNNSFPINGALSLIVKVYPDNATFADVTYSIAGNNDIGAVLNGNILTASDTGMVIVGAEADGIYATQTIYAEPAREEEIAIDDITLERAEFLVTRSLTLVAEISPINAVTSVYYEVLNDGGTGAILENGVLKHAENPGNILLRAYTAHFEKVINVEVLKVGVESVRFACANRFKITKNLPLSVVTIPTNPTFSNVIYEIIDAGDTQAFLSDGVLYASHMGEIKIVAYVDGIASDVFTVYADKEPVTEVYLTSTNRSFKCTDKFVLDAMALPVQATYKNIEFLIDEKGTDAGINARINGNVLTACAPGVVGVIMRCDGHDYPAVIVVEKEPVTDIILQSVVKSDNASETVFRTSGFLDLTAVIFPYNATYKGVNISIIKDSGADAKLVDGRDRDNNGQIVKEAFSGETDKVFLCAEKQGKITVRIQSTDNPNIYKDCEIEVFEEYVSEIYFAINAEANKNTFDATEEPINIKYDVDEYNGKTYGYCENTYMLKKNGTLNFAVLEYASSREVDPTYEGCFELYYYTSLSDCIADTNRKKLSEDNPYIELAHQNGLRFVKLEAKELICSVWVVAVTDKGEGGDVVSPAVKVTVYPKNIKDIKSLGIDRDGIIKPENTTNSKIEEMDGYEVTVNTNKFVYSTFVETKYLELQLKLYKYSLNITEVSVNAVFQRGNVYEYKYPIPMNIVTDDGINVHRTDEVFKGIKALPKTQVAPIDTTGNHDGNKYSAVVLYDFYRTAYDFKTSLTFDSGVRSMFVYGNPGAIHSGIDFTFNNEERNVEITLNNAKFKATNNHDAIRINGEGNLALNVFGDAELYGGDGDNGKAGANGYSGASPRSNSNRSGYSLNGASYGDVQWNPFGDNPDGNPAGHGSGGDAGLDGKRGEDGRNGGFGIRLVSQNVSLVDDDNNGVNNKSTDINLAASASLKLVGGRGGDGGRGGNGDNGQGGQNGGRGGNGGTKYCVVFNLGGKGGTGGNGGNGGDGGNGGNGGNAGCGGLGTNSKTILNKSGVSSSNGSNGKVGSGGNGGTGGYKGLGGSGGNGGSGFYVALVVPVSYTGDRGADGADGSDGKAGNNGTSGTLKSLSNLTDNKGII